MSFDPSAIISLIQNCKALYDYSSDVWHSSKERRRLLDEVNSLQSEVEALRRPANTPVVAGDQASTELLGQLLDPSHPFAKVVDETLAHVKDVLTYGTSNRPENKLKALWKRGKAALWWTVDKAEVKDLLSDLERHKGRIALALQRDIAKKQDDMNVKLDIVEEHLSSDDRLKIAQFISDSDFAGHQKDLLEQRLENTGTWVMEHPDFVAWRDDKESRRTLWCHGNPGAGKSVLAALVVDHLQSKGEIVLSIFCRYSSNTTFKSPSPFLRGLLRQLIEKSEKVLPTILTLYKTQTHPNPGQLLVFLTGMAASHGRPIYVVLDALDECPIRIDLLCAIEQLGPSFRVFVTSRPVFEEIKDHPSIKIRASDHDILVAVDTTLSKLKHRWLDEKLKRTIRVQVVDKADGMFLLASLQLRELERDVTSRSDVMAILDSLPRTLDGAYKMTFERIREQGERKKELACRALALIALNSNILDADDIQELLADGDTQRPDVETILQCCYGLVTTTLKHAFGELPFIHYSVHEYITKHWSEHFPEHSNQIHLCLQLGFSTLTRPTRPEKYAQGLWGWHHIVLSMKEPKDFDQVICLLSTPEARELLVEYYADVAPFAHDPLLIACYAGYVYVMEYMIQTAPPDVQRFNEALRVCRDHGSSMGVFRFTKYINARPDMRVRQGVVVAVDPNEDAEHSSSSQSEDDETSTDSTQ